MAGNWSQPWLDDLSEEWVPQQPTPPAEAKSPMPVPPRDPQSAPPKPPSRLPRLRHSSGSFSEIQARSDLRPTKQRNALAERSDSDANLSPAIPQEDAARDASRSRSSPASWRPTAR